MFHIQEVGKKIKIIQKDVKELSKVVKESAQQQ